MPKAKLQFQIKRGIVDNDSADDQLPLIQKCISLCKKGKHDEASLLLMPALNFEWIWSNCDSDPSEITKDTDDLSFGCSANNSVIKVGNDGNSLVITATVFFELEVKKKKGLDQEKISEWLIDNSAYACGYVGGGWSYEGSDGDNVWVTEFVDLPKAATR